MQNSTETMFTCWFGSKQEQESREALMGLQRQEVEVEGREPWWGEAQTDNSVVPQLPEGQTRQRKKEKRNEMQNEGEVSTWRAATGETACGTEDGAAWR